MPSIITVGFRSQNSPDEIMTSYDLGRELIALGRRLQSDGVDTWITGTSTERDLDGGGGGVITDLGIPIGAYRVDLQRGTWTGGDMCSTVPEREAEGRHLIEHYRCNDHRDGVITEEGRVVYEPTLPTEKGRIRV